MPIYVKPGKVNPYLYLIDTGAFGMAENCAVYLLDGGIEYALFDAGTSYTKGKILRTMKKWNIDLENVKYLIPSHYHFDHAGGIPFLLQKLPNAEVYASSQSAGELKDPTEHVKNAKEGFGTFVGKMEPLDEINLIKEGDVLDVGEITTQVLETPGHTKGDISLNVLKNEKSDTILCGCALGSHHIDTDYALPNSMPNQFDHEACFATIKKIEAINPNYSALAHFGVAQGDDAKKVIKSAMEILLKFRSILEE